MNRFTQRLTRIEQSPEIPGFSFCSSQLLHGAVIACYDRRMNHETIESLAFFLLDKTGTVLGCWRGHMSVSEQRQLFGCYFGAGELAVCGSTETICEDGKLLTNWSEL